MKGRRLLVMGLGGGGAKGNRIIHHLVRLPGVLHFLAI